MDYKIKARFFYLDPCTDCEKTFVVYTNVPRDVLIRLFESDIMTSDDFSDIVSQRTFCRYKRFFENKCLAFIVEKVNIYGYL